MFSLSWHRTSSKPNVNFRLFLFCLTCISFLLGVNCFAAFLSSYPFCLLSPLHNHHFTLNDELVICSLNVRGLSNSLKRRETFRWLKMKKIRQFSDQEGRYIIIDMKIDKILTLVNIYAPNNDNPTFFKIFSIKSSLLNVKKLLWEATLIWSWTFRRIKKEET